MDDLAQVKKYIDEQLANNMIDDTLLIDEINKNIEHMVEIDRELIISSIRHENQIKLFQKTIFHLWLVIIAISFLLFKSL
jgi:hypothetical protein